MVGGRGWEGFEGSQPLMVSASTKTRSARCPILRNEPGARLFKLWEDQGRILRNEPGARLSSGGTRVGFYETNPARGSQVGGRPGSDFTKRTRRAALKLGNDRGQTAIPLDTTRTRGSEGGVVGESSLSPSRRVVAGFTGTPRPIAPWDEDFSFDRFDSGRRERINPWPPDAHHLDALLAGFATATVALASPHRPHRGSRRRCRGDWAHAFAC